MFTFKRMSVRALAMGLVASMVPAGVALAAPTYTTDSGVTFERSGRLMKRTVEISAPSANASSAPAQLKVTYDKGDLGKYERLGRFVHRTVDIPVKARAGSGGFNAPELAVRKVGVIKHVRRS
ncbi:MAG: hypothetical protein AMXMBFR84_49860 [Candidatus Hydrogenedentota bacterium]